MYRRLIDKKLQAALADTRVVLYLGEQRLSFADNLWALPIASLWESA